jgi:prepilin-type N-terminal cleavage/methylation domain-containing protein
MCRIIRKNKERHHPGFTLLEILLAVFILGIVVSTIYAAYSGTFSIVDRTTKEAEVYAMARIALERIVEDLESIYIPEAPRGNNYGITTGDQVGDEAFTNLEFTSRAHLTFSEELKEDTIARIVYYVQEGETDAVFALCRSDQPNPDSALGSGVYPPGPILCEGLTDIVFTYYDAAGAFYDHWNSSDVPVMVTVQLSFLNAFAPETPYMFTTGVAIPAGLR